MPAMSISIADACPAPIVSSDALKRALAKTDVEIINYNEKRTDFHADMPPALSPEKMKRPEKICDSVLDLVGRTPMVRLSRFAKKYGLKCELLAKCEFFSGGGSVKDRIGLQMIQNAEAKGIIKPGDTLVEATSGNTGVAMCMTAAVKGYKMIITMPQKMSQEKMNTMAALGAEIIRTPTEAAWNDIDSHIAVADQLAATLPNCHFLDQYINTGNPQAHYLSTGEEILYQCDGAVDMVVATVGTGGTITGLASKIKERVPTCEVVGVDPRGSILAEPAELNEQGLGQTYLVEGIGYDFIPSVLHRELVDRWCKTDDNEAFRLARELIRLEGLLVGGSSGSALAGVLKFAKDLPAGKRVVVVLPDSSRNYMTKFMSNDWMVEKGIYPSINTPSTIGQKILAAKGPFPEPPRLREDMSCQAALEACRSSHLKEHAPVVDDNDVVVGIISWADVLLAVAAGTKDLASPVKQFMSKDVKLVQETQTILSVGESLKLYPCVVVVDAAKKLKAVLTATDLL